MQDCSKCVLLKKKIELLQEELAERKKADKCPECDKRRKDMEKLQELIAEMKYRKK